MLDIERDSMVGTIAAVRFEERVANAQDQKRAGAMAIKQAYAPGFCILMVDCPFALSIKFTRSLVCLSKSRTSKFTGA